MKKLLMMLALLALPFAMQAQTKFHDAEINEARGPVKKISQNIMGRDQVTTFTQDGKMSREGYSDAVYNENGYMKSAKMTMRGESVDVTFQWADGKVASQTMEIMGGQMVTTFSYNDKGAVTKMQMGEMMTIEFSGHEYDAHGNWIKCKTSMMGQEIEMVRTIEYYE
jgi:uncharacterized protein YxeA